MAFFRRGRKVDDTAEALETEDVEAVDAETVDVEVAGTREDARSEGFDREPPDAGGEGPDSEPSVGEEDGSDMEPSDGDDAGDESFSRARGPFDSSEATPSDEASRLDLGSIRLVPVDGMQLRLELDEEQQTVLGAHALIGDSGVQLQAFAAPRTMGLWADIREEIAQSIVTQGGTADVVRGPLGRELVARMPSRGADGRTVFQPVRFLGVDGPRWFLRAVISGRAALDETAAEPLVELVRSVVVVRGGEAKPPREILPLQLPSDITGDDTAGGDSETGDTAGGDSETGNIDPGDRVRPDAEEASEQPGKTRLDELKPFERGPEITEVR